MSKERTYTVSTSPFLHDRESTPRIMYRVIYSLIPFVLAAIYFFGISALLVVLSSILGSLFTEYLFLSGTKRAQSLKDGSSTITGMLLGLTLPPGFPLWMAFLGGVVAVGMGKLIWGGLGQNIFNPALVGRAFLQAAFPTAITTWTAPGREFLSWNGTNLAPPLFQGKTVEAVTGATPLAQMKFEHNQTPITDLLLGSISGSLGETSALLLIIVMGFLLVTKTINWRVPVSVLGSTMLFSALFWIISPQNYPDPLFMILSGGLLFGTVFMATDLVTSPITPKGLWIYGCGIGVLVVTIRLWGGLPEGVMYAILLMNACTPLINRFTRIKPYGY